MRNMEDIEISAEDVQIVKEGFMPSIFFSKKFHEQLIKPWQRTMVVKLLGRSIGYKALLSILEVLWICHD